MVKVINKLQIEVIPSIIDYTQLFCVQIIDNIINNNVVAASDTSLKSNKIGRYQKLTNPINKEVMAREMFHKE